MKEPATTPKRKGPRKASSGKMSRCAGCVCGVTYDDASSDIAKLISDRMESFEVSVYHLNRRISCIEQREIGTKRKPWYSRFADWFVK